ncbi:MAG: hypothetical protein R3F37_07250 [Candidatus Competibacteraceae bacterium]
MTKRDEYIEKMKSALDNLNAQAHELEKKMQEAKGDAAEKYHEQLNKMKAQRQASQDRLTELQQAGEDKWEELKDQIEHTWKVFQDSVNYFKSRL